jgi:hypothetical protein
MSRLLNPLLVLALTLIALAWIQAAPAAAASPTRILVVVGPSNHPPGTHEVEAGGRLVRYALEHLDNVEGIEARVIYDWADTPWNLDTYDALVMIGDRFPGEEFGDSDRVIAELADLMDAGCGLVTLHYGTGLGTENLGPDGDPPLLHCTGGQRACRSGCERIGRRTHLCKPNADSA